MAEFIYRRYIIRYLLFHWFLTKDDRKVDVDNDMGFNLIFQLTLRIEFNKFGAPKILKDFCTRRNYWENSNLIASILGRKWDSLLNMRVKILFPFGSEILYSVAFKSSSIINMCAQNSQTFMDSRTGDKNGQLILFSFLRGTLPSQKYEVK